MWIKAAAYILVASNFLRTIEKIPEKKFRSARRCRRNAAFLLDALAGVGEEKGRIKRRVFHHCVGYCSRTDNGREREIFVGRQWRHKGRLFCFDAMCGETRARLEGVGWAIGGWGKSSVDRARGKKEAMCWNEGLN